MFSSPEAISNALSPPWEREGPAQREGEGAEVLRGSGIEGDDSDHAAGIPPSPSFG